MVLDPTQNFWDNPQNRVIYKHEYPDTPSNVM